MKKLLLLIIIIIATTTQGVWGQCASTAGTSACALGLNDFWITTVSITGTGSTFNYTGGTCNTGAGFYLNTGYTAGNLTPGLTYTISVSKAGTSYVTGFSAWVDWDNNGVLNDAGEQILTGQQQSPVTRSASFTVPAGAVPGNHRLRVRVHYNTTITNPCQTGGQAEVKDFTVVTIPSCTAPTTQATTFGSNTVTTSSCNVTFNRGNGTGGVLVVARSGSAVNADPLSGTTYTPSATFGAGTQIGTGNYVVYNSNSPSTGPVTVPVSGLTNGVTYHFAVYEYNVTTLCYHLTELTGNVPIPICFPPTAQASGTGTSGIGTTGATLTWSNNGNGDAGVIVVARANTSTPTDPTYTVAYTDNTVFGSGSQIGTGNYVVYKGTGNSATISNLLPNVSYTFSVYTYNAAGLCYMMGPATQSFTTANAPMTVIGTPTVVQQTGTVSQGATNAPILQLQVVGSTGTSPALTLSSITFNINGSSSLADITGARIFYTGTSSTFSATGQFGADVTSFVSGLTPVTVTGSQTLSTGTNYFWLVYDASVSATINNNLDGEILSITAGSPITPSPTAPSGAKQIVSAMGLSCAYNIAATVAYSSIAALTSPSPTVLGTATATTSPGMLDDNFYSGLSIGFDFNFLGTTYTQFGVNANGFIWLGSYVPSAGNLYTPISSTVAYPAIICPLGMDLKGNTATSGTGRPISNISYRVGGTAPNRTLTIQWQTFRPYNSTGANNNNDRIDFQVILYEDNPGGANSNKVQFAYIYQNSFGLSANNAGGRQVGFRGATNADFYNRTQASGHWTNTSAVSTGAAGSTNTATANLSSTEWVNTNPGLTLTFTPTVEKPIVTPSPTATNACPGTTVALTTTSTAPTKQWFKDGVAISGATTASYTATQSGTYVFKASNGSCGLTSIPVVVTITACQPLQYNVTGSNSCNSSTLGVSNFEAGVSYQLRLNGTDVGSPITTGTPGSPISFGTQTLPGTYTVVGDNGNDTTVMSGSVIVYGFPTTPTGLTTQERCLSGNVTFTANTPGAGRDIQWSTDGVNNNAGTGLTYTVAVNPGTPVTMYARTRIIAGNCFSAWVPVVGIAHPAANPHATSDADVCFFDAIALLADNDMVSYSWTGPNSFTSTDQNPFIDQVPLAASGTYTVNVVDTNGCLGSSSVTVTVHATCGTVTWEGDDSNDWNTGSNWNGGFVPTVLNDALIPNVVNDPVLTAGIDGALRHITVSPSATITVNTGKKIGVRGNWTGGYNTVSGAGAIEFNGALAQTITGGGIFTNININNNNAGGVTIAAGGLNQVKITQSLNLLKAPFATNGNIYLTSTSTQTAYINNFTSGYTGSIVGTITMERYNTGATGFRYLSMPINNPSINEINEVGLIGTDMGQVLPLPSCSPVSVASGSAYGNVMEWHENGPFQYLGCRQSGWYVRSSGTLQNMRGYLVKMHQNTAVVVTGTPNNTTQTFATQLNNTNPTGDGWQLMGNPYPSPLQWTGVSGFGDLNLFATSGIYTGTYASFAPVQNKIIASMQGFFVRRLAAGAMTFSIPNTSRRPLSNIIYQDVNTSWYEHLLEIDITGNGYGDHSTLYFNNGATADYEAFYDARKMDGRLDQPTIYTHLPNGGEQLGVNGLGSLDQTHVVPLVMKPGQNGEFTLNFAEVATFPASAMIYLEDLQTGTLTDLRANASYTFTSDVNDNPERFLIRFEPPVAATVADETCETEGNIVVTQPGTTVWSTYELRDNANNLYAQGTNLNGTTTFSGLHPREYILTLTHPTGYVAQEFYTINGVSAVNAAMAVSASTVGVNQPVSFTATTNATEVVWNFGDGEEQVGANVTHSYAAVGDYTVTLTAANDNCDNVASGVIHVNNTTGINNTTAETLTINGYGERIAVQFNNWGAGKADIFVYNTLGQRVETFTGVATVAGRQELMIADIKPGYYFIQVVSNGKVQGKKVYLGSN